MMRFCTRALPICTLKQAKAYAADPNPKEPLSITDCHGAIEKQENWTRSGLAI
jgi:hypothetical protein